MRRTHNDIDHKCQHQCRLVNTADTSGVLALQTAGTTAVSISASQVVAVINDATVNGLTVGKGASAVASNTAVGSGALAANTSGSGNAAFGSNALAANTTGAGQSAFGQSSLLSNTTGSSNTAYGNASLPFNTTASNNTAVGYVSLYSNTTGASNTASNVAIGHQSLYYNTGSNNTAVGFLAGITITTGTDNLCLGESSGGVLTTGSSNIYIGSGSHTASAAGVSHEVLIATGNQVGKGANTGFIQPNGGGVYQGNNSSTWSTTSDQRLKKNIVDNTDGLNKITGIRVRNFEYRIAEEITELPAHAVIDKQGVQLGVIAQELQTVLPDCVKTESTGVMSVDTDNLIWYLVNSIKELKAEIDALKGA
jgi:trimeric autotransporter adhesin